MSAIGGRVTTRTATRPALALTAACTTLAALAALLWQPPAAGYAETTGRWHLSDLRASLAWRLSTGDGVTVAVLDSGVDAHHGDLTGQVLPGADFVDGTTDGRRDFVGHGTTVAALIAGREKSRGVVGLAPRAKILPVRVLDRQNRYRDAAIVARGVRWAVDHGARVVNLSLGGDDAATQLADAIGYAYAHDAVVVACTGNITAGSANTGNITAGSANEVWYPARQPGVLAVSGLELSRSGGVARLALWQGALTGPATVLTAPAVDLLGAKPGGYWWVRGTSFAAPLVAAAAALLRARWPAMRASDVINRLIRTAQDLGPRGRDATYGFGEVDPLAALTAAVPSITVNPLAAGVAGAEPAASASGMLSGAGGPVPTGAPATAAVPAVAAGEVPRSVAWGLGAGVLICIVAAGGVLALVRGRADDRLKRASR
jgi:type VII secretion-associated serine protease mycosin